MVNFEVNQPQELNENQLANIPVLKLQLR